MSANLPDAERHPGVPVAKDRFFFGGPGGLSLGRKYFDDVAGAEDVPFNRASANRSCVLLVTGARAGARIIYFCGNELAGECFHGYQS